MPKSPSSIQQTSTSASSSRDRVLDGSAMDDQKKAMDDPKKTVKTVSRFIDQLANSSSPEEKELTTARLLGISRARKEARSVIGSHAHALSLFISILRNGTPLAKVNVASILSALCKDEDLRLKVLLGGCIPPLLMLLKSESAEARKAAAEAIHEVSFGGLLDDQVGMKIFVTEGVVPTLWEHLMSKNRKDKVVEGFITGALRNLCNDKDGCWRPTLDAGGVEIIVGLLSSDDPAAQSNASSLLARLMLTFTDSITRVIDSGAIKPLLQLVGLKNDISVRASAAEALEVLSSDSSNARKAILDADGVHIFISAIVAPSKECLQGEHAKALQEHATRALANICDGMSALILRLGELSQAPRLAEPISDIIGAFAYVLMVFEQSSSDDEETLNPKSIEDILVKLLKPRDTKLIQDRILEAMASMYENDCLSKPLKNGEAKRVLIRLITVASVDVREHLILCLFRLCHDGVGIWEAIGKREGIQLLMSFLGLPSEQHQEYAVQLLANLTDEVEESRWAITAAGGIPPLVQLLEIGSQKAKEDAAHTLCNLCCHSEDIRVCVERADAIPAFLSLLKNGGPKAKETSALALKNLVQTADSDTIGELLALLRGNSSTSKTHVISVLGHVLTTASQKDLLHKGSAANEGLRYLVQVLNSSNEENKLHAASVLVDLFNTKQEICDSLGADDIVGSCMKLLNNTPVVASHLNRAVSALSRPPKKKSVKKKHSIAQGDIKSLLELAKATSIDSAESAVASLANLLSDPQIAAEALEEDILTALTRILEDGTSEGKKNTARALHQLLEHFSVGDVLTGDDQCHLVVLSLLDSLKTMNMNTVDPADALEVVSRLATTQQGMRNTQLASLIEVPSTIQSLVRCLAEGPPLVQDKAIQILSRISAIRPVLLGELLNAKSRPIGSLTNRIANSSIPEVKVGGTALLICVAKEHKQSLMKKLDQSKDLKPLISTLVDMMKQNSSCSTFEIEVQTPRVFLESTTIPEGDELNVFDKSILLGSTVAMWLLSFITSCHIKSRLSVMEAGGVEALCVKLAMYASNPQVDNDAEGIWISALLSAIMFQDTNVVMSPVTTRIIPSLAQLLRFDNVIHRYFAAQALASLISNKNNKINLAIVNSGAVTGLISLLGCIHSETQNLIDLSIEFSLAQNPDQVALEQLFLIEDIKLGSSARKSIPLLVNLLKPMPGRPCAPTVAVQLLTRVANESETNKVLMAEAGALDALAKYLSLSPQDSTEFTISELLRILFSNPELIQYEAAFNSMNQLIAVLHLGSRSARQSAARALNELFEAENIKKSELAWQAFQPLTDMLDTTSESEQEAALCALVKLTSGNTSKLTFLIDVEGNPLENLYKILSDSPSMKLKICAANLCTIIFDNKMVRGNSFASECMGPLISLMQSNISTAAEAGMCAFEKLLDDERQLELAVEYDVLSLLVGLISGTNHRLIESSIASLIKLGKDQTPCKLEMVKIGVIDKCLLLLPAAPCSLCASIAEFFRILTNSGAIARSSEAAKIVEPIFMTLHRSDFSMRGQHSALQVLLNILEKPQSLATLNLTPSEVIAPLISYMGSPSEAIQQLGSELLSHLLELEHFQQDITTEKAVIPLVKLAGIGILNLQQTAIKALETLSASWPKAVVDAGGVVEISKIIIQEDPQPSHSLWESAAYVLSNILRFDEEYYFEIPVDILVKMLLSTVENTVIIALNALLVLESNDSSCTEEMAEAGAVDALLDLLCSHQCEEASGRLLEALFTNVRVREMKVSKCAIAPLSQYLLDPQTISESSRLLAALALGDLSRHEGLAKASDSASACHAFIRLLDNQPTEEMTMVAICALQNFVMHSRTNRRAVAEAGGIWLIQELLLSCNGQVSGQAALMMKYLFSNHTLQEYVSHDLIKSLTAALERELCSTGIPNEEVLSALNVILTTFPKLGASEAAALCIPHLIEALKSGSEPAQHSVLDTLYMLRHSRSNMTMDIAKSQAMVIAEAVPIIQMLLKTWPPSFYEKADGLLHSLPGCLTVIIKGANNLNQETETTNAFCRLAVGNGPPRKTKVVNESNSPEWNERFTWAFDVPPKGQKLHILCKSKNTSEKSTLGKVSIQIDKVVTEGVYSGLFNLNHDSNDDEFTRTLEIEISWSNRTPDESI